MKVWVLFVNGKVDSLWHSSQDAMTRSRHLKEVNGSQLSCYFQELTVQGKEEK